MEKVTPNASKIHGTREFFKYSVQDLLKITNCKLEINTDETEVTVHTDGLQFSDYDQKTLFPKVQAVLALSQAATTYAHYKEFDSTGKTFRDFSKLTEGRAPFLLSSKLYIYPTFYDVSIPKNPLIVKVTGGNDGNTTIGYTAIKYTKTGEVLCKNDTTILVIDRITGRPVAHPDWWKSKHSIKSKEASGDRPKHIQKLTPPDEALRYQVRVAGSDIDLNLHTNWLSYFKFAEDAIYHFAKRNMFEDRVNAVIETGMLEYVELFYSGETFEGDLLDVLVWTSDHDKTCNVINTQIQKNKKAVLQTHFQYFHRNDESSKEYTWQTKL